MYRYCLVQPCSVKAEYGRVRVLQNNLRLWQSVEQLCAAGAMSSVAT